MKTYLSATVLVAALGAALAAPTAFAQSAAPAAETDGRNTMSRDKAPRESPDPQAQAARESAEENGDGEGIDPVGTGDQALDKEEIETGPPGKPATTTEPAASTGNGARPQGAASADDTAAVATAAPPALQTQRVPVSELVDYVVVNEAGEELGEVERVGRSSERYFVIVGTGGLLGLGEREVALPLDRMIVGAEDRLVMPALTQGEMDRLSGLDVDSLEGVPEDQEAPVGMTQ